MDGLGLNSSISKSSELPCQLRERGKAEQQEDRAGTTTDPDLRLDVALPDMP